MKLRTFFSHPAVGIIGSMASLVGVLLAVYFYRDSIRAPHLTYYVHPARTTVVKAGQASALSVGFKGKEISSDVTAVQIAVWNAGKEPIRSADVLTPVEIVMEGSIPILESTLRKVSRDITHVSIDDSEISAGKLRLNWRILEQNDGCVIQVIYAGTFDANLSVVGAVVGQQAVDQLRYSGSIMSPTEQYTNETKWGRITGCLMLGMGLISVGMFVWLFRSRHSDIPLPATIKFMTILLPVTCFGGGLFLLYMVPSNPPFGF